MTDTRNVRTGGSWLIAIPRSSSGTERYAPRAGLTGNLRERRLRDRRFQVLGPIIRRPEEALMTQATATRPSRIVPEEPREVRGVLRLSAKELRFQRRLTLLFTAGPLAGVAIAIWALWGSAISG